MRYMMHANTLFHLLLGKCVCYTKRLFLFAPAHDYDATVSYLFRAYDDNGMEPLCIFIYLSGFQ
jgi:hypothetical protein